MGTESEQAKTDTTSTTAGADATAAGAKSETTTTVVSDAAAKTETKTETKDAKVAGAAAETKTLVGEDAAGAGEKAKTDTADVKPLELKLPEWVDAKDPLIEKFRPLAAELGLDSAKAQKFLDLHLESLKPVHEAAEEMKRERAGWVETLRKDPTFGGANFDENVRLANLAAKQFGGVELGRVLRASGLGDHPAVVKALAAVGKALGESSTAGGRGAPPAPAKADPLRTAYPSMFPPA